MPITIASNRRRWLAMSCGLAATTVTATTAAGTPSASHASPIAILSDTHIAAQPKTRHRGVDMREHLERAVSDLRCQMPTPGEIVVNGDCAFLRGRHDDYLAFAECIEPLIGDGHRIHLVPGNHDDRETMLASLSNIAGGEPTLRDKHAGHLRLRDVDLYLIDTLERVNHVAGRVGDDQLRWLDEQLGRSPDRPAVVIGHHPLQRPRGFFERLTGLRDTEAMRAVLDRHRRVAAYINGHDHQWKSMTTRGGWMTVGLPTTAYVFDAAEPTGYVIVQPSRTGMTLRLRTIDLDDPRCNETKTIDYMTLK